MEQDLAILISDLSGYTALTETHGSSAAADTIDKYITIVKECLSAKTELHQTVGDEVVIVSPSADELLATAVLLLKKCSEEEYFLQLHGALHYGKILKRNNNYFGSGINLTSRIASAASKGTFWCSKKFIDALSNKESFTFLPVGKQFFKNLSEEQEIFELVLEKKSRFYIDPVCRMLITQTETAIPHPEKDIFFCSMDCYNIYMKTSN